MPIARLNKKGQVSMEGFEDEALGGLWSDITGAVTGAVSWVSDAARQAAEATAATASYTAGVVTTQAAQKAGNLVGVPGVIDVSKSIVSGTVNLASDAAAATSGAASADVNAIINEAKAAAAIRSPSDAAALLIQDAQRQADVINNTTKAITAGKIDPEKILETQVKPMAMALAAKVTGGGEQQVQEQPQTLEEIEYVYEQAPAGAAVPTKQQDLFEHPIAQYFR